MSLRLRPATLVYALGFTVALPAGLAAWAETSPLARDMPTPPTELGPPLTIMGVALWAWAVAVFIREAGKLPLNADTPARAVEQGPYRVLPDPIYVGFGLAVLGVAIWSESAAGVWIVAPVTVLAMIALVAGFEQQRRPRRATRPWLDLPSTGIGRDAVKGALAAGLLGGVLMTGAEWPGLPAALAITGALAVFAMVAARLHDLAVGLCEALANSWRARRLGPLRVISYAPIAAGAAGAGAAIFSVVAPDPSGGAAAIVAAAVLLGAGLWGWSLESTGRLARPFGYFGAVLGGLAGVVGLAVVTHRPLLTLGAALVLAAPWIQAVGRLRCLVQGCCFGRPLNRGRGICYRRPESRAVALGGLAGQAVHATPLISIYANLLSGLLLARLYLSGASAAAILAAYLIVAGLSRFAEEGLRGEADVRRWRGLTLYQLLAIGQLMAGIGFSLAASAPLPAPAPLEATGVLAIVGVALVFGFAMGVDFPDLDAPLARLTPSRRNDS